MRRDVLQLREFYASPLGQAARRMIGRKVVEAWGDVGNLDILALGYATPFVGAFNGAARRVVAAMPAQQGVEVWPIGARNAACLAGEDTLPFANALFDRILAVHVLEESPDALTLLREVWRVLAPSGRVIVAVAARNGLWANSEGTPFGHGRPYSRAQLAEMLREAELEPTGWTRALYVPPVSWMSRWAEPFEQAGSRLWPKFAGVVLTEAVKQTFAVKPQGAKARVRIAPPLLAPAPVGPRVGPMAPLERDALGPSLGDGPEGTTGHSRRPRV